MRGSGTTEEKGNAELRCEGEPTVEGNTKVAAKVRELAEAFFPGLLEAAVGESETVRRKPDPSAVLTAARRMGVEIGKCVYVGDSEVDVETARNAGMDGIFVSWGFRDREQLIAAGAGRIADSAGELEELLMQ